jgi:hypothetical protein
MRIYYRPDVQIPTKDGFIFCLFSESKETLFICNFDVDPNIQFIEDDLRDEEQHLMYILVVKIKMTEGENYSGRRFIKQLFRLQNIIGDHFCEVSKF